MTEKGSWRPRIPLENQNGAKSGREIQLSPSHRNRSASADNWLATEDVHIDATPTEVRHIQGISDETVQTIKAAERELFTDLSTAEDNLEDSNFQIGMSTGRPNGRGTLVRPISLVQEREIHGGSFSLRTVEIAKIPGETLGFYIREGNGMDRRDGIFVSRLMLGGAVEGSGLIRVGDEIVFVNSVDVMRKTLDEVYLIMQIPTRLLLTFKRKQFGKFLYRPKSNEGLFYSPARYLGTLRTNKYKKSKMNGGSSHSAGDIVHAVAVMETESESQDSDSLERVQPRRGRGSLDIQATQGSYYPESNYERETSSSVASTSRASLDVPLPNHSRTQSLVQDERTDTQRYRKEPSRRGPGSRSASTSDDPDTPSHHAKVLPRAASYGPDLSPMDDDATAVFVDDEDYDDLTMSESNLNNFDGLRHSAPVRHPSSTRPFKAQIPKDQADVGNKKPPPGGLRQSSSSDDIAVQSNGKSRPYRKSSKPHSSRDTKSPRPRSAILDSFFPSSSSRKSVDSASNGSKKQRTSYLDLLKQQQLSTLVRNVAQGGRKSNSQNTSAKKLERNKALDLDFHDPKYIPKPSPDKKTRHSSQSKPLDMDLTDFSKYKSDVGTRVRPRNIPCSGILALHLYGGRKMTPSLASKKDTRDLYAVVEVDTVHKAQTATVSGKEEFCWDEKFEIDLEKSHDLTVMTYTYNIWEPDVQQKPCHRGVVRFSQLLMQAKTKDEVFKLALRLEPRGIVYMVLTFVERHATLQRVPSLDRKGLFGVQLDVVVQRENSGRNVPIIVQKCVEEIEDRGLSYIGVYRVCGSAKRKKRLREEFDISSSMVDLSRDNYPDINVITGMLKDYLRELPEPLFTNKLCGELQDTFSSRSLEDPICNGELLLNMIESLPPSNKETGSLMLDHLKAIANLSEVNKMNPYNLAVCFGPVLMSATNSIAPPTGKESKRGKDKDKDRGPHYPKGRSDGGRDSTDYEKHIEVLQSMIEIWPGRRERGEANKANQSNKDEDLLLKDEEEDLLLLSKQQKDVPVAAKSNEQAPPVPLQGQEEDSCYHSNDDLDEMVAAGGAAAAEVEKKLQELNWDSDNLEVSAC